jgi:hypothetical protein
MSRGSSSTTKELSRKARQRSVELEVNLKSEKQRDLNMRSDDKLKSSTNYRKSDKQLRTDATERDLKVWGRGAGDRDRRCEARIKRPSKSRP